MRVSRTRRSAALELDRVDVGRELEVVVQRVRRALGIVRRARLEQLDVELLVPVLHGALRQAAPAGSARTSPTPGGSAAGATRERAAS